jgi:hypothetical protein
VNRGDLSWALSAVLPHAGSRASNTDWVGLAYREGVSYAFATDKYTLGVARIPNGADVDLVLPAKEATELEQFVRPSYKDEHEGDVVYARQPGEFHVGFDRQVHRDGTTEEDSAVFETADAGVSLTYLFDYIRFVLAQPTEYDECIYQPSLMQKFAKAKRVGTDRLRIFPRRLSDAYGAALVTVGTDFVGAVAGLTYDELGTATVADFLTKINLEGQAA